MLIDNSSIEKKQIIPGFRAGFVHTHHLSLAIWEIKAGSNLPSHSHEHEQVSQVISGSFEFSLEGETHLLTPGFTVVIPSHAKHGGKAITDCQIVDVFYPVRTDYK